MLQGRFDTQASELKDAKEVEEVLRQAQAVLQTRIEDQAAERRQENDNPE